ncbi:nucleoside-diphosphate-sugar epimerase family protein [Aspergillus ibericus CBS 121593]|uniref:Nucleoside-diphosphate-sugar epimerase family protein n=1 Tax=Aspergillus ibericus CBS 121593 TaxID=1448316 RepID=A0A395GVK8_9EURO|nr:nucleoside-diphosphate-sugar epimerase family protein [Aspergillus ibericus CBS 121593]RAK99439.1 nucleoside-diphosphate-sugar epimerase family protein [Aspergillus ibericus CBS 121593]
MTAVLITGATGKQGGALIRNLIARKAPFEILAVTRDATSASAQRLKQLSSNIKLVEGNLDNPAGIFRNAHTQTASPIWGVFSVQLAIGSNVAEEAQGKALVDESLNQDVKFFVYSSVDRGGEASWDNPTKVPHFYRKHNIEHHLADRAKGKMDWTILRPVAFIDNLVPGFLGKVFVTAWKMALKGKPLQVVAVSDVGYFAAEAFLNPDKYKGQAVSLAGDELTYDQMVQVFQQKTGQHLPTTYEFLCSLILSYVKEMGSMYKWFHDEGFKVNIGELRKQHPGLKDVGSWLEQESEFVKR